jgi:hypothetical protein
LFFSVVQTRALYAERLKAKEAFVAAEEEKLGK